MHHDPDGPIHPLIYTRSLISPIERQGKVAVRWQVQHQQCLQEPDGTLAKPGLEGLVGDREMAPDRQRNPHESALLE